MGESLQTVIPMFNRSLHVESRTDRLTGDPGAVLLREILERSGIVGWMTARLKDPRSQVDVTHDLASLIRTSLLLVAQGWRDHHDADALRYDPARRAGGKVLGGTDATCPGRRTGIPADLVAVYGIDGGTCQPEGAARGSPGNGRAGHQGRAPRQTAALCHP